MQKELGKIKWKYFLLASSFIILSILLRIVHDVNHYQNILDEKVLALRENVKRSFDMESQFLIHKYNTISQLYVQKRSDIMELVEQKERLELYRLIHSDYILFKSLNPSLSIMHFHDSNTTTILRMHKPEHFNDPLKGIRPMIEYVNESHQPSYGFEVGKNGITYRIANPLTLNGKHIGVLEFGTKPQYFVEILKKCFGIEAQILIKSDSLKVLDKQTTFQKIGDYTLIYQDKFFEQLIADSHLGDTNKIITHHDGSYLLIDNLDFFDHKGVKVAKIIVAYNVTFFVNANQRSLTLSNLINIGILFLALVILYIILSIYSDAILENIQKIAILNDKIDIDGLTNVYNKVYFNNYMEWFMEQQTKGVLLFFDIDHFKYINDTYGHLVGDEVLKHLAHIVKMDLRGNDILARWGGEEFIVLLYDTDHTHAILKAKQLLAMVSHTNFTLDIHLTISIGVREIERNVGLDDLILQVDKLLYRAKKEGRNRVCY